MTEPDSHLSLFNDERYLRCNLRPEQRIFRFDHVVEGRLVGTLSGVVQDGVLHNGYSAPFGGIDWVRPHERPSVVVDFLHAAVSHARSEGIVGIVVCARPDYFGRNETLAQFAMLNLGATIRSCELSLGLETWRFPVLDDYERVLRSTARNKLRQGLRSGMQFGRAAAATDWVACYEVLAEARHRRGVQLKISCDYVLRMREIFGERIAMYRLMLHGEIAAAALVYRVTPHSDYVVAWGDTLCYRHEKPMNVMAFRLIDTAITAGVGVIDLGISSVDGVPDDGLIRFKESIDGVRGLRLNLSLPVEKR